MPWLLLVLSVYAGASLVTAALYWRDKRAAQQGRRRIPERTLHIAELLGGWPGALVARQFLRHKTRKWSYRLVYGLILAIHVAAWAVFAWIAIQNGAA